jgi:hypothetical protein
VLDLHHHEDIVEEAARLVNLDLVDDQIAGGYITKDKVHGFRSHDVVAIIHEILAGKVDPGRNDRTKSSPDHVTHDEVPLAARHAPVPGGKGSLRPVGTEEGALTATDGETSFVVKVRHVEVGRGTTTAGQQGNDHPVRAVELYLKIPDERVLDIHHDVEIVDDARRSIVHHNTHRNSVQAINGNQGLHFVNLVLTGGRLDDRSERTSFLKPLPGGSCRVGEVAKHLVLKGDGET